jgi:hypothetical protein
VLLGYTRQELLERTHILSSLDWEHSRTGSSGITGTYFALGGGGGGGYNVGGGGGAGGLVTNDGTLTGIASTKSFPSGTTPLTMPSGTTYTISIGAGGTSRCEYKWFFWWKYNIVWRWYDYYRIWWWWWWYCY